MLVEDVDPEPVEPIEPLLIDPLPMLPDFEPLPLFFFELLEPDVLPDMLPPDVVVDDIDPEPVLPMLPLLIEPLPAVPIDPDDMPPVLPAPILPLAPVAPAEPEAPAAPDAPAPPLACAITATGVSAITAAAIMYFRMILSCYGVIAQPFATPEVPAARLALGAALGYGSVIRRARVRGGRRGAGCMGIPLTRPFRMESSCRALGFDGCRDGQPAPAAVRPKTSGFNRMAGNDC